MLEGGFMVVYCVEIQDNNVGSGSNDKTVRIWDLEDIHGDPIVLEGHSGVVISIAIQDNNVVSGSIDMTVRIWDLEDINAEPIVLKRSF